MDPLNRSVIYQNCYKLKSFKKIYHLGNCTTCQAIIKETGITDKKFDMQNIKEEKITPAQLEEMKKCPAAMNHYSAEGALKYKNLVER